MPKPKTITTKHRHLAHPSRIVLLSKLLLDELDTQTTFRQLDAGIVQRAFEAVDSLERETMRHLQAVADSWEIKS